MWIRRFQLMFDAAPQHCLAICKGTLIFSSPFGLVLAVVVVYIIVFDNVLLPCTVLASSELWVAGVVHENRSLEEWS